MKLSHKLEYACRVLAQLALRYERGQLAHVESLAEVERIPANYLVQILKDMRNADIILSKRGKQGGYILAKAPEAIGLIDIVRAVDPELLEQQFESIGHSGQRVAEIWSEVGLSFEEKIQKFTLADFVVDAASEMYYI